MRPGRLGVLAPDWAGKGALEEVQLLEGVRRTVCATCRSILAIALLELAQDDVDRVFVHVEHSVVKRIAHLPKWPEGPIRSGRDDIQTCALSAPSASCKTKQELGWTSRAALTLQIFWRPRGVADRR